MKNSSMARRILASMTATLLIVFSSTTAFATSGKLTTAGSFTISGSSNNSVVANSALGVAYTANTYTITQWSLTNPANPQLMSSLPLGNGAVKLALSKQGDYLYAIGSNGDLTVYSTGLSDAPALTEVGSAPVVGQQPDYISVNGNYVYVADWGSTTSQPKVEIYNVSNPSSPTEVSTLGTNSDSLASPVAVAIKGNYAYITSDANATLNVFNVAKPAQATFVASLPLTAGLYNNSAGEIDFSGAYAYVTGINANVINIVNIATPSSPVLVSTVTPPSQNPSYNDDPYNIVVKGNNLYVDTINGFNQLVLSYDITNPSSPIYRQTQGLDGQDPNALSIYKSYLYVLTNIANGPSSSTVYIFKI